MVLPTLGITLGAEEIQTTVQTVVALVTGLYIWSERVKRGDVNVFGVRK